MKSNYFKIISPFLFILISAFDINAQIIAGEILDYDTGTPIGFVNIGVVEKGIGTVSNSQGKFNLNISHSQSTDTIIFSCIGYITLRYSTLELTNSSTDKFYLKQKTEMLNEVIIVPKSYIPKIFGVKTKSKLIEVGFESNELGYECGTYMKNSKSAILKSLNINISRCTYDSIFYRVNIYKVLGKKDFQNILNSHIYLKLSRENVNNTIFIDLTKYNIQVETDFLVTLEHIKDLGKGKLYFCSSPTHKSFYRETSQGKWTSVPIGIGINIEAIIEK